MNGIAVEVSNLVKDYYIYDTPLQRLKEIFLKSKNHRHFRALGPITLTIKKGETVGIIGENGAGKSTFLKIIAGVLPPTAGHIVVNGRVASILELGTGFFPEFTGRENIRLNAALYGISRREIDSLIEEIEEFADIGEFFDMPVKMYSSGMYMRLAFSLSANVNADVLIIDEALAVGDGLFMKKCIDKIWEIKKRGTTIVFCSHSLYLISSFCENAIWFKNGLIAACGDSKETIKKYEDFLREKQFSQKDNTKNTDGNRVAKITDVSLITKDVDLLDIPYKSMIRVDIRFDVYIDDKEVYLAFAVDRNDGICCYAESMKDKTKAISGKGSYSVSLIFEEFPLLSGIYKVVIFLLDDTYLCVFDREESKPFKINSREKQWGICYVPHKWLF